jgi:hypothetical protein
MTEYDYLMRMVLATEWEKPTSADYRHELDHLTGEPGFRQWLKRNPYMVLAVDIKIDRIGERT